jgi:nitronate monooxygenase
MRLELPVVAAPMAGGASTPAMSIAAGRAGGLGFLPAGYKSAQAMADQIATVRASGVRFGVNLFAPNPLPVEPEAFRRYAQLIGPEAEQYGLTLTDVPYEDDDGWADKVEALLADPVEYVSCTFGIPSPATIQRLQAAGTQVVLTVTAADEARLATEAGADLLVVQCSAAGGHSGTLTPQYIPPPTPLLELLAQVRQATDLPLLAAGGLASEKQVREVIDAGASAAVVGTALLLTDESGASATHRAALHGDRPTVVTKAFTGRLARGLRNDFIDRYEAEAPLGYPALHHLTSPLRKAAAAAGDAERVHLWAGTGYRQATAEPVAAVLQRLAGQL